MHRLHLCQPLVNAERRYPIRGSSCNRRWLTPYARLRRGSVDESRIEFRSSMQMDKFEDRRANGATAGSARWAEDRIGANRLCRNPVGLGLNHPSRTDSLWMASSRTIVSWRRRTGPGSEGANLSEAFGLLGGPAAATSAPRSFRVTASRTRRHPHRAPPSRRLGSPRPSLSSASTGGRLIPLTRLVAAALGGLAARGISPNKAAS